ncbi:trigger factor [Geobacter sp. DSM 9736]|uniref:trigger factor n=1 Tax=Geobacter sp. DSM 9736 TaxID=1277350 RepID=UPI000B500233|nr:trigger factor [Geobacter sp. DSM 9736]SNB45162.1 trigger factor [Geobacter sp. DSM 9736]
MQITVEKLSSVKKKINVEIPADRVGAEIDKAYDRIRKHAAIKGFRKGKVPQSYLEKYYSERMQEDVLKNIVNDTYFQALMDQKIYPVSHPMIESDDLKKGETFKYSAIVEVFPEIEVKDYLGLEVKKEEFVPSPEAVEKRLTEMRESLAQLKPIEEARAVASGDFVTLDFTGFVDGAPIDKGSAEDFVLEIGSGKFIPGFEEQLIGMDRGIEGNISVNFPENYSAAELSGKEATFAVRIKEIKVKELPSLDDDLAKEFGEYETLEQLKDKIAELYEKQEKGRIEGEFREQLIRALIERNDIEVPEALVEKQVQLMLDNAKSRLASQNLSLEMMGLDEKRYKSQFRGIAENQVKGSLLLDAVAKQENVKAEESDLDEEITKIATENNQDVDKIRNYFQSNEQARENLLGQIRENKAVEFLIAKAKVSLMPREKMTEQQA